MPNKRFIKPYKKNHPAYQKKLEVQKNINRFIFIVKEPFLNYQTGQRVYKSKEIAQIIPKYADRVVRVAKQC